MTEQEKINENLQRQIDAQNARIDNFGIKVDGLIRELQDFKHELRDRDNQRAKEIMEMRQKHDADMKELQKNFYTKMDKMDEKIESIGNHVRNLTITSMAAIGAMVVTVIISLLRN